MIRVANGVLNCRYAEASELGLAPGHFPKTLVLFDRNESLTFDRPVADRSDEGETLSVSYVRLGCDRGSRNALFTVYND